MSLASKMIASWPSLALLILAVLLPVYGPFMAYAEGSWFPVTSPIAIVTSEPAKDGLDIRYSYTKYRNCEFVGVSAKIDGTEVGFEPVLSSPPGTRSTGQQISRLWHLDAPSLDGVRIYFTHRCHPFWIVAAKVYG